MWHLSRYARNVSGHFAPGEPLKQETVALKSQREPADENSVADFRRRLAHPEPAKERIIGALQLSPGEQQRIAFARALVQKPDWLFLDEATSAVDEATEARLYRLVRERLTGTTVFSVGHRATLRPFHSRQLLVRTNGNRPASIVEVTAVPELARRGLGVPAQNEVAAMAG